MNGLPCETLLNILRFLPGREVQRLKSVCKKFGAIIDENPMHMRKIKASMTISDGYGKCFLVETMPFELCLEIGDKELRIYADRYGIITGNSSFCRKFAFDLQRTPSSWFNQIPVTPNIRAQLLLGMINIPHRGFNYQVNKSLVHSRDFPIVVLFERIAANMEIIELTIEPQAYPLMQHVLGELAKRAKFRVKTMVLPVNCVSNPEECERFEICRILDWEMNRNSEIELYNPTIVYGNPNLNHRDMETLNALGRRYSNVFWVMDLKNLYDALMEILMSWVSEGLNGLHFGFQILQGAKLNMWSTRLLHQRNRRVRENKHNDFVREVQQLGICSNYYDSKFDEWVDIATLPSEPLEFYFGDRNTIKVIFEKKDEETAIVRLSMIN